MIAVWIDGKQSLYEKNEENKVIAAVKEAIRREKHVEVIPDC